MSDHASLSRAALMGLCSLLLLSGCPGDDGSGDGVASASDTTAGAMDSGSTGAEAPFDEAEVIEQAGMYATQLEKINAMPFASAHGLASTVNVYVSPDAAAAYRTLDPAAPGEVDLPAGTLVVKEHLDAGGAFSGYLMMYRGPAGYDEANQDWFFARVDGAGATQETGAVGFCITCHEPAPSFLFGVAADNQT